MNCIDLSIEIVLSLPKILFDFCLHAMILKSLHKSHISCRSVTDAEDLAKASIDETNENSSDDCMITLYIPKRTPQETPRLNLKAKASIRAFQNLAIRRVRC